MNSRTKDISTAESEHFDLAILGGGIHGAQMAREAVLRGYRVLLLEARDYAFGTSSRSSKMLHGGVRYLESGDFSLVRESLLERAMWLRQAPHLAKKQEFWIPSIKDKTRPAWQIRFGLWLYDMLGKFGNLGEGFPSSKLHSVSSAEVEQLKNLGLSCEGLCSYFDGQMDDARLVIESILDARMLGATCLNYAPVSSLERAQDWLITWKSSEGEHQSKAKFVVNLTGPWVPEVHKLSGIEWDSSWPKPVFSRGTHLLFDVAWNLPGLVLPTPVQGRYYFVWPYFSPLGGKTLVGTTDRAMLQNEPDPQASESEIEELLSYVKADLPGAGLDQSKLYKTFAGMRILAGSSDFNNVSSVSRECYWITSDRYLALLGGKYTSARKTAEDGLKKVDSFFGKKFSKPLSLQRVLPGAVGIEGFSRKSLSETLAQSFDDQTLIEQHSERLFNVFGVRASEVLSYLDSTNKDINDVVFKAQCLYAKEFEQAQTMDDVLRRRTGLSLEIGVESGK